MSARAPPAPSSSAASLHAASVAFARSRPRSTSRAFAASAGDIKACISAYATWAIGSLLVRDK
eukprot:scaffold237646_cov31-Tisochrysis_lutea.AAC.2